MAGNDDIEEEEEEEYETKENHDESKMKKRKVVKTFETQMKTSKKEKCRSKERDFLEDSGIDHKEQLQKSKKLEVELRKGKELERVEHGESSRKSARLEVRHDTLVKQLKKNFTVLLMRIKRKCA